jgi:hypothetical protein
VLAATTEPASPDAEVRGALPGPGGAPGRAVETEASPGDVEGESGDEHDQAIETSARTRAMRAAADGRCRPRVGLVGVTIKLTASQGSGSPRRPTRQFEPPDDFERNRLTGRTMVRTVKDVARELTGEARKDGPTVGHRSLCRILMLLVPLAVVALSSSVSAVSFDATDSTIASAPLDPPGPAEQGGGRTAADSVPAATTASTAIPSPPQTRSALQLHPEGRPAPAHRERIDRPPRA